MACGWLDLPSQIRARDSPIVHSPAWLLPATGCIHKSILLNILWRHARAKSGRILMTFWRDEPFCGIRHNFGNRENA